MPERSDLLRNAGRIYIFDEAELVHDFVELTIVDSVKMTHPSNPIEIKTPSGFTIYKSIDPDAELSFDWYHPGNLTAMELLFRGAVSLDSYDGSTEQSEIVVVNFRQEGEAFVLPGFNGNKSVVTISAVTLASDVAQTYDVTDDYTVDVDPDTGISYIEHVVGGAIEVNTDLRVTYGYTPLASNILRPVENAQLVERYIMIDCPTDPNDPTKYRRYFLPRATVTSDMMHSALEFGQENSNPNIMPVTLKYAKPETGKNLPAWYWIDTVKL